MPAHNAGRYVAEAIASIQKQTYPHWELCFVDDASSDATPDIVQKLAAQDGRIRYTRVARLGTPSRVRNVGLAEAQGHFITFLDADDCYFPDTLAMQLAGFAQYPEATAVYGFPAYIDAMGQPLPQGVRLLPLSQPDAHGWQYQIPPDYYQGVHAWERILTGHLSCMLPGLMLRRETLARVGGLNEDLLAAEDYEFYVRLLLDDFVNVRPLPAYVYEYRVYAESLTKTAQHFERILDNCCAIMDDLFGVRGRPGWLPPEAMAFRSQAYTHLYRYHSRERILHQQPEVARRFLVRALKDGNVGRMHWLRLCFPLLLRSFMPSGLNTWLVRQRWRARRFLNRPLKYT
jgi:glycosyltransferase involved in cell wall biosynthesis